MNRGVGISALAHTVLILAAMFSGQIFESDSARAIQITEVEIVTADALAVERSTAPQVPNETLSTLTTPQTEALALESPQDTIAPEIADAARPGSDTADAAPDLSAIRNNSRVTLLPQAPETPQDLAPDAAPEGVSLVTPRVIGPAIAPRERQRPNATAMAPPAPPTPAPRLSTTPAEKPPSDAQEARDAVPQIAPDPASAQPVEERTAQAPPEAASEIVPEAEDAQAEPESAAPLASAPPRKRPEGSLAKSDPAEELPQTEDAASAPAPEAAPAAAPPVSPSSDRPIGPPVTQAEKDGITLPIRGEWNFVTLRGVEGWEQLVVALRFSVAADGTVSDLRPHNPANPQGNFKRAYDAARRAILAAERKGLLRFPPQAKYERWKDIIITFDPKTERVGF